MSRPATGQVVEREGKRGTRFSIRFRADGKRSYFMLDVDTREAAEEELRFRIAQVEPGIW
jgi:hypothetical protein